MRIKRATTVICLMVLLSASFLPAPATAGSHGSDDERTIRLYASARFGPIGTIKLNSLSDSPVAIDGRIAESEAPIWGGELIRVRAGRTARVSLDSIGQVTLAQGAMVRLATATAASEGGTYTVLVATVVLGSMDVKLSAGAGAYVEAGRSALTASPGASFGVSVRDGRALLTTASGHVGVQDQTATPQDVLIRVVDELGRPVASGSQFSVRARSTRQIQVQVTDRNDRPLPDMPVLFSLGNPCLGTLGVGAVAGLTQVQRTDNRGIAAVPLVAGAAACAATIVATVQGTNASVTISANVQASTGFWSAQNTTLVVVAAAAAGVTTGVVVANQNNNEPITPVPPPGVKP
jgi:hypothetical protein